VRAERGIERLDDGQQNRQAHAGECFACVEVLSRSHEIGETTTRPRRRQLTPKLMPLYDRVEEQTAGQLDPVKHWYRILSEALKRLRGKPLI
jgi:hypothetical protein